MRRLLHATFGADRWPGAEALVRELVTLPTHSYVGGEDGAELTALVRHCHC